jgi:Protein of unknown function (DUF4231)
VKTYQNQKQTREDIEAQIEECKDVIYQHKHALWWYFLGRRTFLAGLIGSIVIFNTPLTSIPLCQAIAMFGSALSVVAGIGLIAAYAVPLMATFDLQEIPIISHQNALREAKKALTKLLRQRAQYDEHINNQLPSPEQHAERLPSFIANYRKQANRYRQRFVILQLIVILLSVTVTSLSGGWLDRYISLPWTIPVGSGLVSLLSTFLLFFKPREKGANLQETADAMDLEFKACGLGIAPYNNKSREEAWLLLAERTEALRKIQLQKQQQLEQASQTEQKDK